MACLDSVGVCAPGATSGTTPGCIADDFTGATDLASMLVEGGMRTLQTIGVPQGPLPEDADAVVVALKSRSIPAAEAIAQSVQALEWLRAAGCRQYFFKYCSTFDSTREGNIGPVADALMTALDTDFTIASPLSRRTGERSTAATCSSTTCFSTNPACRTTR